MKNAKVAMLFLLMVPTLLDGQSIINTLGSGGTFTIKDGSTTFLSLSQSDGYLDIIKSLTLPVTTGSTVGVIFKDTVRFIHNYWNGLNTFIGMNSGNFTMDWSAISNTAAGNSSLRLLTSGTQNSAFGEQSLTSNTTGIDNCAFGYLSLESNSTGSFNSAFGVNALASNTIGTENCAFGIQALFKNTEGGDNCAFGPQSLLNTTTGGKNSAFGCHALYNDTASGNSAFGYYSLGINTAGTANSAFGYEALYATRTGQQNTGVGSLSLYSNATGNGNVAVGYYCLYNSGDNNNTAIGNGAGSTLTTGWNTVCVGYNAQPSAYNAYDEITLGNGGIAALRCHVGSITTFSDIRDKKNVRDLTLGLDFLMNVRPRQFNWDRRDWYENGKADGSKMEKKPTAGFVAQELDQAQTKANAEWLNLVLKSNPERLEATSGNLLPVMVKAIQELKNENDELKNELVALRASIAEQVKKEVKAAFLKAVQEEAATTKVSLNDTKN